MADQSAADRRGALKSLEAVFEDARPHLLRLAQRLCRNDADADDLLQTTFLRAVQQGIPSDVRNTRAWLTTILKNAFVDQCRSTARHPTHEPISATHDVSEVDPDGPEPPWTKITVADIRDALDDIDPGYREAYILHTFEHKSYEEIARVQGVRPVTVGTRLNRARKRLREVLVARFGLEDKP